LKTYEGMFLLDAGQSDFDEAVQPIRAVLDRNQAELVHLKKWDERRLAYEIRGRRRGLYVLAYFRSDPAAIGRIERDVQLNESILRLLILSADHLSDEAMATPTPAEAEINRREEAETEEARKAAAGARAAEAETPADAAKPAESEKPAPAAEGAKPADAETPAPAAEGTRGRPAPAANPQPAPAAPAHAPDEGEGDKTAP